MVAPSSMPVVALLVFVHTLTLTEYADAGSGRMVPVPKVKEVDLSLSAREFNSKAIQMAESGNLAQGLEYFKKALPDLTASSGLVPEYNSSNIQKCFSPVLYVF